MRENLIGKIYDEISQTEDFISEENKTESIAKDTFRRALLEPIIKTDFSKGYDLDILFIQALCEKEKFGFIQGFKYAMKLKKECDMI